jgi:hypothetical protein
MMQKLRMRSGGKSDTWYFPATKPWGGDFVPGLLLLLLLFLVLLLLLLLKFMTCW